MADFIKGLIFEIVRDFAMEWWWLSIPAAALLGLKFAKRIPSKAKVVVSLAACVLGGYLIGLRKPPDVVEKLVEKRVEIPVDRIVEKRVEVPTFVEKIKEVFVKPSAYGNCIECGASFHLDGATGQVKCPRCGKVQQAKSAADMADTLIANKNAEIDRLKRGLLSAGSDRERRWQAQPLKYDAKCPQCGHLIRFPGSESAICGNCRKVIRQDEARQAWAVYRSGTGMISQDEDKPAVPYTEKAMAAVQAVIKANAEAKEKAMAKALLPCPGCKFRLQFNPNNYSQGAFCRVCNRYVSQFEAQYPKYFKR